MRPKPQCPHCGRALPNIGTMGPLTLIKEIKEIKTENARLEQSLKFWQEQYARLLGSQALQLKMEEEKEGT